MRIGSLFSGYGGLDLAVAAHYGATVAWHVECDKWPSAILAHHYPDIPNYGDVTAVDWSAVEPVDIITGGFPCQPFSQAGQRRGTNDDRHLWPYMVDAIAHLRPSVVVAENVRGHLSLGFDQVLRDFDLIGYDVRWCVVRAADAGAPHSRARIFIVGRKRNGCLRCGLDRRGGLHRNRRGIRVPVGTTEDQHDRQGQASTEPDGSDLRGQGGRRAPRRREVSPDDRVEIERTKGIGGAEAGRALVDGQAGDSRLGAGVSAHGRHGDGDTPERPQGMDGSDATSGEGVPRAYQGDEPTRPRSGAASDTPTARSGEVPLGRLVAASGQPVRPGGVRGDVPDVGADGRWICVCDGAGNDATECVVATDATRERGDRGGDAGPRRWAEPTDSGADTDGLTLLPTPLAADIAQRLVGQVLLLPSTTWAAARPVEGWDEWTADMRQRHGNGNGHGKSLEIEAQRLLPTPVAAGHLNRSGDRKHEKLLPGIAKDMHSDFGPYTAAIARWEQVLGRPAPPPTEPGQNGRPRLSPRFVEFMMGLPDGWVTDVPGITRSAALKALGNGVVPHQAALALELLDGA